MPLVDVWTISLTEPHPGHDAAVLSFDETARAARLRFEGDRIRWIRSRAALRAILGSYLNQPAAALRFVTGPHGKPALQPEARLHFNLSHAGDYALLALCEDVPVGIDIERVRPKVDIAALLRRLSETDLPDTVPELFQRWTQREARSKAAGGELFAAPLTDIVALDITAPEGYAASIACTGSVPRVRYC